MRARLCELAGQHRRFGYLRLHALLRRKGLVINRKKTYCLYQAGGWRCAVGDGLGSQSVSACAWWCPRDATSAGRWTSRAMPGRRLRCLCIVDDATRESPALLPDFAIGGARVVRVLDELACRHGLPEEIVMDNGPEFTGRALFA